MRPMTLDVEGLGSWRRPSTIDLAKWEVVAVTGANGAGKSTLVEAMEIALFGRPGRTRSLDSVVSRGVDQMRVALEFTHGGGTYRVTRERVRAKRTTAVAERLDDDGAWVEMARGVDTVDRWLGDTLGLSRESYLSTAMLSQGDAARFCEADPSARKALFAEMLGLERFASLAEAAKAKKRDAEVLASSEDRRVEEMTAEIAGSEAEATELLGVDVSIEEARDALADAERRLDAARGDSALLTQLQSERDALQRQIAEAMARSKVAAAEAEARRTRAKRSLADVCSEGELAVQKLDAVTVAKTSIEARQARLADFGEQLNGFAASEQRIVDEGTALRGEIERLAGERERLAAAKAELIERIEVVNRDPDAPECYACGQPLTAEHRRALLAEIEDEITKVANGARAVEDSSAEKEKRRDALRLDLKSVRAEKAKVEAAEQVERTALVRAQALAEQEEECTQGVERAMAALADAEAEVAAAEAGVSALGETVEDHAPLALRTRATEVEAEITRLGRSARAVEAATRAQQAARTELERLTVRRGALAERLRRCAEVEQRLVTAKQQVATSLRTAAVHGVLERAFGRDGVPRLVVEGALAELEVDIMEVLERLSASSFQVHLVTERDKKSGGVAETLDIVVETGSGAQPFEMFSGGERLRIALAVNAAMARLMRRRCGEGWDLLVFDEPAALDEEGVRSLVDWLWMLRSEISCIAVITHLDQVASAFDQRVVVERDEVDGSRLVALSRL